MSSRSVPFVVLVLALAIIGVGLPWAVASTSETSTTSTSSGCPRLILYYSRGSGQGTTSNQPGAALFRALQDRYGSANVGEMENSYPAVPVNIRATARYLGSVAKGVIAARLNIRDLALLCSRSSFILGGYSQGAQVVRATLATLGRYGENRVAAAVLFGDPYFDPEEESVTYFPRDKAYPGGERERRGIFARRLYAKRIPIDNTYEGHVFSWCHPHDLVCEGLRHFQRGQHGSYAENVGEAVDAIKESLEDKGVLPARAVYLHKAAGTCEHVICGLAAWNVPGTRGKPVGAIAESQTLEVVCQSEGESVTGSNGRTSDIWDKLADGSFVPDFYVDTKNVDKPSPPIPSC